MTNKYRVIFRKMDGSESVEIYNAKSLAELAEYINMSTKFDAVAIFTDAEYRRGLSRAKRVNRMRWKD